MLPPLTYQRNPVDTGRPGPGFGAVLGGGGGRPRGGCWSPPTPCTSRTPSTSCRDWAGGTGRPRRCSVSAGPARRRPAAASARPQGPSRCRPPGVAGGDRGATSPTPTTRPAAPLPRWPHRDRRATPPPTARPCGRAGAPGPTPGSGPGPWDEDQAKDAARPARRADDAAAGLRRPGRGPPGPRRAGPAGRGQAAGRRRAAQDRDRRRAPRRAHPGPSWTPPWTRSKPPAPAGSWSSRWPRPASTSWSAPAATRSSARSCSLGLGGTAAEALADVAVRLAPADAGAGRRACPTTWPDAPCSTAGAAGRCWTARRSGRGRGPPSATCSSPHPGSPRSRSTRCGSPPQGLVALDAVASPPTRRMIRWPRRSVTVLVPWPEDDRPPLRRGRATGPGRPLGDLLREVADRTPDARRPGRRRRRGSTYAELVDRADAAAVPAARPRAGRRVTGSSSSCPTAGSSSCSPWRLPARRASCR